MKKEYSIDEIEAIDRTWTDTFYRTGEYDEHELSVPTAYVALFLNHIAGPIMLDAGCGSARYADRFWSVGLAYRGIDHSQEALARAKQTNPQLTFDLGSIRALPYANDTFDGIWSCCVLSGIPKRFIAEVLAEHKRVLKPGGLMAITMPLAIESDEGMVYEDDKPIFHYASYVCGEFEEPIHKAGLKIYHSELNLTDSAQFFLVRK